MSDAAAPLVLKCEHCGLPMQLVDGGGWRWKALDPDTGQEHFILCTAAAARARRIRYGYEDGYYPVSPSSIKSYLNCPWGYLLEHWSMLKAMGMIAPEILALFPDGPGEMPPNPFGDLGNYVHRYIACRLRNEEPPPYDGPLDLFRDWRWMRDTFERQVDRGDWSALRDASVEEEMTAEWVDRSGQVVQIKVIIDFWRLHLSDDGFGHRWVRAVDHKSGRDVVHDGDLLRYVESPAEFRVEAEHRLRNSIQAGSNMWVLSQNVPDFYGGTFVENHLRFNGEMISAEFRWQDLEVFGEAMASVVARMIADRLYRPNRFCRTCPPGAHPFSGFLELELEPEGNGRKL
ncbi:MAG TPA: hypothetical protein VH208_12110, partial [Myxococcaceae bacterium]|nr:hypothetical protein [Myxococcaceae bacterium]